MMTIKNDGARPAIAIHGGAGTILQNAMTPEREATYRSALRAAIGAGSRILEQGGPALVAVQAAIVVLEDEPLFNAGRGSVLTHYQTIEMDALIADGSTEPPRVGAVAGLANIRNPILLARDVLEKTEHVLLGGPGAALFGIEMGAKSEPDEYFVTEMRLQQLNVARDQDYAAMDHAGGDEKYFGTVGAVALDIQGNLAAGTSTGGMTNKKFGRIGDSPVFGCGTYARNATCAVSCTGHGEYFIRSVVAHDISCLMEYAGFSLNKACAKVVHEKLAKIGGSGGVIAVDARGNIEMQFNSNGMYRAMKKAGEEIYVGIFGELGR